MYNEAWQRGWSRADKRVILADGAVWIWNIADREFPGAVQIVDIYHAREHLWVLAGKLFGDERQRKRWAAGLEKKLDAGKLPHQSALRGLLVFTRKRPLELTSMSRTHCRELHPPAPHLRRFASP